MTKRAQIFLDLLLLAALFWIVRYWHSRQFGLYEDNLTIIPTAIQMSFRQITNFIFSYVVNLQGQGRPLHHSFIYFFSWLGFKFAGLWGSYLIGYLFTTLNIFLFYGLIRRIASRSFALLASICYLLFSADVTQAYLTHSLGIQPSITFVLLALHSYLSSKRLLAYILAFLILFGYETPFLIFLAAPLLQKSWNKKLLKELALHSLVIGSLLVLVYVLRMEITGSAGVLDITPLLMLKYAIEHMIEGPFISLFSYIYRPIQAIYALSWETGIVVALAFLFFWSIISSLPISVKVKPIELWLAIKDKAARTALPEEIEPSLRLAFVGSLMLVLAYPLTFTQSGIELLGRSTRVHTAGVVGAAILTASLLIVLSHLVACFRSVRFILNGFIAFDFALLAGFGFMIQRDYILAWQYQRAFWTDLLPLIPDAGDGTVILVDPEALSDTEQIGANTWNLPRVLDQIYEYPSDMKKVPGVNRLDWDWQNKIIVDGQFVLNSTTLESAPDYYGSYTGKNIILIQAENGQLVRRYSIDIKGINYVLKSANRSALAAYPHGYLYNLMIIPP